MQKKGVDSSFDWMFSGINRIHNLEPSPELAKVSFEVDFDTHPGPHKVNEDKLLRLSQQGFFGAFDGMGGTLEAALPSSTEAAEAMRRGYTATRQQVLGSEPALTTQSARQLVDSLMLQANQGVLDLKKSKTGDIATDDQDKTESEARRTLRQWRDELPQATKEQVDKAREALGDQKLTSWLTENCQGKLIK